MKAFDRGERVAGKRKSAYSSDERTETPNGDVDYEPGVAERMDQGYLESQYKKR
jgi:hypothetical protein